MSERECYKLVKLDVKAAEHGWQRVYDSERSEATPDDPEGDWREGGVWTRDLPDGRVVMFGIAYGRRRSTRKWNVLVDEDGKAWHAVVGDERDTWELHWPTPGSINYWLEASGEEFLERHKAILERTNNGRYKPLTDTLRRIGEAMADTDESDG